MTDKQIIIDVTQCPHYKEKNVCTFLSYETKCEGECSWVTYKEMEEKLKRKEQECSEYSKELARFQQEVVPKLRKRLRNKEQECEELRKQWEFSVTHKLILEKDYYAELDQLKAENETLKQYKASKQASYESMQREWNNAVNENRELKAENEALKRKISHYENLLKLDFTKSRTAEEVVQHANYLIEQGRILLIEENHKLKQTLTEIKEIAENNKHSVLCFTAFEGDAIEVNNEPMAAILQKISEVEDG